MMGWFFLVEGVIPVVTQRPKSLTGCRAEPSHRSLAEGNVPGHLAPASAGLLPLGYVVLILGATSVTDRVRAL